MNQLTCVSYVNRPHVVPGLSVRCREIGRATEGLAQALSKIHNDLQLPRIQPHHVCERGQNPELPATQTMIEHF